MKNVTYEWDDPFFPMECSKEVLTVFLSFRRCWYVKMPNTLNWHKWTSTVMFTTNSMMDSIAHWEILVIDLRLEWVFVLCKCQYHMIQCFLLRMLTIWDTMIWVMIRKWMSFTWNWEMDDRLNTYVPLVVMRILNLVNDCIILYLWNQS